MNYAAIARHLRAIANELDPQGAASPDLESPPPPAGEGAHHAPLPVIPRPSLITPEHLTQLGATAANAERFAAPLNVAAHRFGITTPRRLAAFLAQCAHESALYNRTVENLNYSVEGLLKTFSRARITAQDAQRLGRLGSRAADQPAIANIIYGGEWGRINLGNTAPTDGWDYRGRGLIQLTGRSNYTQASQALSANLVGYPDIAAQPEYAALTAAWFWHSRNLSLYADNNQFDAITRAINGGTHGAADRNKLHALALDVLGVA